MNKCLGCAEEFLISSKYHPNQLFCSKRCRANVSHRKKMNLPITLLTLNCKVCDILFKQKRTNNDGYCCQSCKRLAASRKLKGLPIQGKRKHIKGSGYITNSGYKILSKKHPNSSKRGQILEHVLIMSNHLNRPLLNHEKVHHKNGIRDDNRIDNLELWTYSHPPGQRVIDKIEWAKEFLKEYGYEIQKIK